ncbi:hypothetical protein ACFFX0_12705 [Citricoccus parietis]|uniref:Uncharacterized protein n=1 Tax=Citricoccus parietis TaxID=592307 RepID=A0ABV5FZ98_9MICC
MGPLGRRGVLAAGAVHGTVHHQGGADAEEEHVLGHGGALLGGADAVRLGHEVGVLVHRQQAAGEGGQGGTGQPARHERQQAGGADADLGGADELLELLRGQVLEEWKPVGSQVPHLFSLLLRELGLVDARVQDEGSGGQPKRELRDAHGISFRRSSLVPRSAYRHTGPTGRPIGNLGPSWPDKPGSTRADLGGQGRYWGDG